MFMYYPVTETNSGLFIIFQLQTHLITSNVTTITKVGSASFGLVTECRH